MHSGDLATMDQDGYVKVVGRIKDMVIRGGENVYPREIEEFLYTHPDIADVQVIGVPDERYGEELMAWVIARAGAALTEQDVREFCRGKIAVLPRQDRALQDPAVREIRRRLPDDRHRQGPEVQDAPGRDPGARPRRGGGDRHGVAARPISFRARPISSRQRPWPAATPRRSRRRSAAAQKRQSACHRPGRRYSNQAAPIRRSDFLSEC